MKYMMLFRETAEQWGKHNDPSQQEAYMGGWGAYIGELAQSGVMVGGEGLLAPDTSTTLRVENGSRQVSEGTFAETKEAFTGFVIIDVPDLETALDWAAKAPCAKAGSVEIRPTLPSQSDA